MTNLSQEQEEMRQSIQKSAMIWSVVFALAVATIAFWALGGQSILIRLAAAAIGGLVFLVAIFKWRFAANSKSAQCGNCSTAFSICKTDHTETLKSSTAKETRDAQEDFSTKVTTWTEEIYDVKGTYTCASCKDETVKEYTSTRKIDEKAEVEPAPVKSKVPAAKAPAKRKTAAAKGKASSAKGKTAAAKGKITSAKGKSASAKSTKSSASKKP